MPGYDFNWQLFYYPKTRVKLPAGTRVDLVAHYDNSDANRNNPDPTKAVRFGEASTAEMMFGMFEFTADSGVSPKPSNERTKMEALMQTLPRDAFSSRCRSPNSHRTSRSTCRSRVTATCMCRRSAW